MYLGSISNYANISYFFLQFAFIRQRREWSLTVTFKRNNTQSQILFRLQNRDSFILDENSEDKNISLDSGCGLHRKPQSAQLVRDFDTVSKI